VAKRAEGGTLPPPYFTVRKAPKALPGKRGPWCWPGAMPGAWSLALSLLLAHLAPTSVKRVG